MSLNEIWFVVIAVLWAGYFVLDGFDLGVGVLLRQVGRTPAGRRVLINTIGPVWDGNEVWLITAAGAMFAAFPQWYATVFSAAYLPMLAMLVGLIVRGVTFEYRGKGNSDRWRRNWDIAIAVSSFVPAVVLGLLFGSLVRGLPLRADHDFAGSALNFLSPFALLTALLTLTLFVFHGAVFLALKTADEVRDRARKVALPAGLVAAGCYLAVVLWMQQIRGGTADLRLGSWSLLIGVVGFAAIAAAVLLAELGRDGWSFLASAVAVLGLVASMFTALFPVLLPSTTDRAGTLDIHNAAAGPYALTVMSWVALALIPFVVGYQAWSYWVFRKRISTAHIPPARSAAEEPVDSGAR